MTGWTSCRLDECTRIVGGATPDTSNEDFWNGDIAWATPKDLSNLQAVNIDKTDRKITEAGLKSCAAEILPVGSVLFSSRAPIGHVAINTIAMATNQGFKSFIPIPEKLYAGYLYWWLKAKRSHLEGLGNGATFKEVSKAVISRVEIPLPPLDEQRRIAAILDQADALRRKRRRTIELMGSLGSSIFESMFGDLVGNAKRWPEGKVSDIVSHFESGKNIVAEDQEDPDAEFRVLKVSAVTSLFFRPQESKALPSDYIVPDRHLVRTGDLLFSRANTKELIGATALVDCECKNLALPDKIWKFCWLDKKKNFPLFVWFLFRSAPFRKEIGRRATGTSGSMKNISQEKVLGIEIGLPDEGLQETFSMQIDNLMRLNSSLNMQMAGVDGLLSSLQHRAFSGQL